MEVSSVSLQHSPDSFLLSKESLYNIALSASVYGADAVDVLVSGSESKDIQRSPQCSRVVIVSPQSGKLRIEKSAFSCFDPPTGCCAFDVTVLSNCPQSQTSRQSSLFSFNGLSDFNQRIPFRLDSALNMGVLLNASVSGSSRSLRSRD